LTEKHAACTKNKKRVHTKNMHIDQLTWLYFFEQFYNPRILEKPASDLYNALLTQPKDNTNTK
jgi:hypothetical protein